MFGSTVGVSAPSSACLFVMFHSSIWNLHTKMKKSTKSEPPVRLRQGSHLRWSNTTKQVKLKKGKSCSATVCVQKLSSRSESPLGPGGWDCSLEELLLGVEQDVLLAGDDGDALPAEPGDGVEGGGGHSHGVGDLLRVVV